MWAGWIAMLAWGVLDAHAVRPSETTHIGIEPTRVLDHTAQGQALLRTSAPWQAFLRGEGAGWEVRWDEAARTPRRAWGPGIAIDVSGAASVGRDVAAFIGRHEALLGVVGASWQLRSANYDAASDAWYVDVDVSREGLSVWRGGLTFRIKHGNLTMFGAASYPEAPVLGSLQLSQAEAVDAAVRLGPAPAATHTDVVATAYQLPQDEAGKVVLRTVWEVRSRTKTPLGHWVSFVDAETGDLVASYNEIRFVDGHIDARHDNRNLTNTITSPLPFARIGGGFTNADGDYSVAGSAPLSLSLDGQRVRILDQQGSTTTSVSAVDTVSSSDFGGREAPLTTYVYLHEAQYWAELHAPCVAFSTAKINAYVNINDSCNAYYDGDVNFFSAGSGCNNTGRQADVIFHEWGHGFHNNSILSGWYDGNLGEGAADTLSFLLTDDSRIAPQFYIGGGTLRNVDNTNKWPDDYTANDAFVHSNGLIFGGAMWHTREAIRRQRGEPYATEAVSNLYVGLLKGGPDIEGSFDEAMFADDDDGNLGNGTPHLCELIEGFGLHGLGVAGDWALRAGHTPIVDAPAEQELPVVASLSSPAPACIDSADTRGGKVYWRTDPAADWSERDLLPTSVGAQGEMPPFQFGQIVEYWLEVDGPDGLTLYDPPGGPIRPHTFYVGGVLEIQCDDFEETDGGFTHALLDGEASEGADDWQWGIPRGKAGDPSVAASGNNIWGTDLGEEGWNGEYQNEKRTRLSSPVYDLEHYNGAILGYRRWLNIEDGYYDRALIYADDKVMWTNWSTTPANGEDHHLDDAWAMHFLDITEMARDGEVQLHWELESDAGLSFGGWNIDDVCVYVPATTDNRMAITDLRGFPVDGIGGVELSWTNPRHAPLEVVRLVRKPGAWPLNAQDGTAIAEFTDVELGSFQTYLDETAQGRQDLYYAVYGYDGDDWLSWTFEGLNGVRLDAGAYERPSGIDPLGITDDPVPCGCTSSRSAGWAWLMVLGLLLRRRRA